MAKWTIRRDTAHDIRIVHMSYRNRGDMASLFPKRDRVWWRRQLRRFRLRCRPVPVAVAIGGSGRWR